MVYRRCEESRVDGLFICKGMYDLSVILQPGERPDEMGQDEAVVFEVIAGEDNDEFVVVDDEDVIDEVFTEYNRLYDEQNS